MARTEVLENVPSSEVEEVMQDFRDAGATKVKKTKQPDGNYTVTAEFSQN